MYTRGPLRLLLATASLLGCGAETAAPRYLIDASAEDRAAAEPDAPTAPEDAGTRDVAAPDVIEADAPPATGACSGATPLTRELVQVAGMVRVSDGFVVAWVPYGESTARVQSFTEAFVPQSEPLSVSLLTNGADTLSLSFVGESGVLATGSSLYFLSLGADRRVTLTNRHDFPRRLVRFGRAVSARWFYGLIADGTFVHSNGTGMSTNTPGVPLDPPHGAGVSILSDGGGYLAFEARDTPAGRRLHVRRFIFGHGTSLEVTNRYVDEASASPVVEFGGSLHRLVYRGAREVDVALERRDPEDLAPRGSPTLVHAGAAWSSTDGALGTGGSELFMAWAARPAGGGYNSALRALWEPERASAEVYRSGRDRGVHVFGAETDRAAARGWALFGERDATGALTLLGRCVDRRR
ncbi:MAG: hypothetical protein HY909_31430 [Deltaproteobacteria bacterium]|nr:hypothetical protein [Deltaproteobacteria bacterium]